MARLFENADIGNLYAKSLKLKELQNQIMESEEQLAEITYKLAEKDGQLAEKDGQLAEKDEQLLKNREITIKVLKKAGVPRHKALEILQQEYQLKPEEAFIEVEHYWEK